MYDKGGFIAMAALLLGCEEWGISFNKQAL
jgi:hypothetical protein